MGGKGASNRDPDSFPAYRAKAETRRFRISNQTPARPTPIAAVCGFGGVSRASWRPGRPTAHSPVAGGRGFGKCLLRQRFRAARSPGGSCPETPTPWRSVDLAGDSRVGSFASPQLCGRAIWGDAQLPHLQLQARRLLFRQIGNISNPVIITMRDYAYPQPSSAPRRSRPSTPREKRGRYYYGGLVLFSDSGSVSRFTCDRLEYIREKGRR